MIQHQIKSAFQKALPHVNAAKDRECHVIINPSAGMFRTRKIRTFEASEIPTNSGNIHSLQFHVSRYPGHAGEIAESILHSSRAIMLISLGGDGTHREILERLHTTVSTRNLQNCKFFRFPCGSGNDAADGQNLQEAWQALIFDDSYKTADVISIHSNSGKRWHSFNVTSIGMDAHVARIFNFMSQQFPATPRFFYQLIADITLPFYPAWYGKRNVSISGSGQEESFEKTFILGLLAIGIGGGRIYGNGIRILPGLENICAIAQKNLLMNIKTKRYLYRAEQKQLPNVWMYSARDIAIHYKGSIPIQCDGEVYMLNRDDFPLSMRIVKTAIPVYANRKLTL